MPLLVSLHDTISLLKRTSLLVLLSQSGTRRVRYYSCPPIPFMLHGSATIDHQALVFETFVLLLLSYSVHLLTFRRLSFYNFNTWLELYLQSTPYHCHLPSVSLPTPWPSCSTPAETPWSLSKLFLQDSKF